MHASKAPRAVLLNRARAATGAGLGIGLIGLIAGTSVGCHEAQPTSGSSGAPYDPVAIHLVANDPEYNQFQHVYHRDLPGNTLVTNYNQLVAKGLVGHDLTLPPDRLPWPASFYPAWFGGTAGRWKDSAVTLVWRSLFGFETISASLAFSLARNSATSEPARRKLGELSPTEKYDIAVGDYAMLGTRLESKSRGHNIPDMLFSVPFWSGICNGIATAGIRYREPVRDVDAVGADGQRVRFEPTDVKALLGLTQSMPEPMGWISGSWTAGLRCNENSTDSPACNDINPATFLVALANRMGVAHKSFTLDMNPLAPVINVSLRRARIDPLADPIRVPPGALGPGLEPVRAIVPLRFELEAASTLISANRPDRGILHLTYEAELALGADDEPIGGRWTGPRMSGPDFVWGATERLLEKEAVMESKGHVMSNPYLHYNIVAAIAEASASPGEGPATVDLTPLLAVDTPDVFPYALNDHPLSIQHGRHMRVYGRVPSRFERMSCRTMRGWGRNVKDWHESPGDSFATIYTFPKSPGRQSYFDVGVDVADSNSTALICRFFEPKADTAAVQTIYPIYLDDI